MKCRLPNKYKLTKKENQLIYKESHRVVMELMGKETERIVRKTEEDYNSLMDLLKRDEPKKVEIIMSTSDETKFRYIDCSNCYEHFAGLNYYCGNGLKWSFCPSCGHRIDWGDLK